MTEKSLPKLTLVLGGASSGKSTYAENLFATDGYGCTYIATAQAFDAEMRAKIDVHRARRGQGWTTLEAPIKLSSAIREAPANCPILLDCVTLWLSNLLLQDADLDADSLDVCDALASRSPVVVVSNEVGLSVVPESRLGRLFRTAQGHLNQRLAAQADRVVLVTAGLPLVLKDT